MPLGAAHALPALLLEDADLWPARLAFDHPDDLGIGHKWRTRQHFAAVFFDEQALVDRELRAGLARRAIDRGDPARDDLQLTTTRLNDCVHIRHLCKGDSVARFPGR